jgi:uncharacterized protein YdaU (DUF1376 family)
MVRRPSLPFFTGDFLTGTMLMSRAAVGAYISMLCSAWEVGPIPDNEAAMWKAMHLSPTDPPFAEIWAEVRAKWQRTPDGWINLRLERTRVERDDFVARQRAKGILGGRPQKAPAKAPGLPNQKPQITPPTPIPIPIPDPSPTPKIKTQTPAAPGRVTDPLFARFWTAYPRKVSKAEAWKAWQKLAVDAVLVDRMTRALEWQCQQPGWLKDGGRFVPHPATWLNGRQWEDEPFEMPDPTDLAWDRVLARSKP